MQLLQSQLLSAASWRVPGHALMTPQPLGSYLDTALFSLAELLWRSAVQLAFQAEHGSHHSDRLWRSATACRM